VRSRLAHRLAIAMQSHMTKKLKVAAAMEYHLPVLSQKATFRPAHAPFMMANPRFIHFPMLAHW